MRINLLAIALSLDLVPGLRAAILDHVDFVRRHH